MRRTDVEGFNFRKLVREIKTKHQLISNPLQEANKTINAADLQMLLDVYAKKFLLTDTDVRSDSELMAILTANGIRIPDVASSASGASGRKADRDDLSVDGRPSMSGGASVGGRDSLTRSASQQGGAGLRSFSMHETSSVAPPLAVTAPTTGSAAGLGALSITPTITPAAAVVGSSADSVRSGRGSLVAAVPKAASITGGGGGGGGFPSGSKSTSMHGVGSAPALGARRAASVHGATAFQVIDSRKPPSGVPSGSIRRPSSVTHEPFNAVQAASDLQEIFVKYQAYLRSLDEGVEAKCFRVFLKKRKSPTLQKYAEISADGIAALKALLPGQENNEIIRALLIPAPRARSGSASSYGTGITRTTSGGEPLDLPDYVGGTGADIADRNGEEDRKADATGDDVDIYVPPDFAAEAARLLGMVNGNGEAPNIAGISRANKLLKVTQKNKEAMEAFLRVTNQEYIEYKNDGRIIKFSKREDERRSFVFEKNDEFKIFDHSADFANDQSLVGQLLRALVEENLLKNTEMSRVKAIVQQHFSILPTFLGVEAHKGSTIEIYKEYLHRWVLLIVLDAIVPAKLNEDLREEVSPLISSGINLPNTFAAPSGILRACREYVSDLQNILSGCRTNRIVIFAHHFFSYLVQEEKILLSMVSARQRREDDKTVISGENYSVTASNFSEQEVLSQQVISPLNGSALSVLFSLFSAEMGLSLNPVSDLDEAYILRLRTSRLEHIKRLFFLCDDGKVFLINQTFARTDVHLPAGMNDKKREALLLHWLQQVMSVEVPVERQTGDEAPMDAAVGVIEDSEIEDSEEESPLSKTRALLSNKDNCLLKLQSTRWVYMLSPQQLNSQRDNFLDPADGSDEVVVESGDQLSRNKMLLVRLKMNDPQIPAAEFSQFLKHWREAVEYEAELKNILDAPVIYPLIDVSFVLGCFNPNDVAQNAIERGELPPNQYFAINEALAGKIESLLKRCAALFEHQSTQTRQDKALLRKWKIITKRLLCLQAICISYTRPRPDATASFQNSDTIPQRRSLNFASDFSAEMARYWDGVGMLVEKFYIQLGSDIDFQNSFLHAFYCDFRCPVEPERGGDERTEKKRKSALSVFLHLFYGINLFLDFSNLQVQQKKIPFLKYIYAMDSSRTQDLGKYLWSNLDATIEALSSMSEMMFPTVPASTLFAIITAVCVDGGNARTIFQDIQARFWEKRKSDVLPDDAEILAYLRAALDKTNLPDIKKTFLENAVNKLLLPIICAIKQGRNAEDVSRMIPRMIAELDDRDENYIAIAQEAVKAAFFTHDIRTSFTSKNIKQELLKFLNENYIKFAYWKNLARPLASKEFEPEVWGHPNLLRIAIKIKTAQGLDTIAGMHRDSVKVWTDALLTGLRGAVNQFIDSVHSPAEKMDLTDEHKETICLNLLTALENFEIPRTALRDESRPAAVSIGDAHQSGEQPRDIDRANMGDQSADQERKPVGGDGGMTPTRGLISLSTTSPTNRVDRSNSAPGLPEVLTGTGVRNIISLLKKRITAEGFSRKNLEVSWILENRITKNMQKFSLALGSIPLLYVLKGNQDEVGLSYITMIIFTVAFAQRIRQHSFVTNEQITRLKNWLSCLRHGRGGEAYHRGDSSATHMHVPLLSVLEDGGNGTPVSHNSEANRAVSCKSLLNSFRFPLFTLACGLIVAIDFLTESAGVGKFIRGNPAWLKGAHWSLLCFVPPVLLSLKHVKKLKNNWRSASAIAVGACYFVGLNLLNTWVADRQKALDGEYALFYITITLFSIIGLSSIRKSYLLMRLDSGVIASVEAARAERNIESSGLMSKFCPSSKVFKISEFGMDIVKWSVVLAASASLFNYASSMPAPNDDILNFSQYCKYAGGAGMVASAFYLCASIVLQMYSRKTKATVAEEVRASQGSAVLCQ